MDDHETLQVLKRCVYLAEHLMLLIDDETWKATGGDDGQGHYEGLYHRDKIYEELQGMKKLTGD